MLVKIGDSIYNSECQPIVLVLSDEEKELIGNMSSDNHKYCSFPEKADIEKIKKFMKIDPRIRQG